MTPAQVAEIAARLTKAHIESLAQSEARWDEQRKAMQSILSDRRAHLSSQGGE